MPFTTLSGLKILSNKSISNFEQSWKGWGNSALSGAIIWNHCFHSSSLL